MPYRNARCSCDSSSVGDEARSDPPIRDAEYDISSLVPSHLLLSKTNSTKTVVDRSPLQGRSVAEMIVKATALSATTTIAAGHLTTLSRQPIKLASYQVIATILIPTCPMSDIAISMCRTFKDWKRRDCNSTIRYYLSAALDERAVAGLLSGGEDTVPLSLVPCQMLDAQRESYDLRWSARLVTLSVFSLQAFLTIWFWIRDYSRVHVHILTTIWH